MRTVKMSIRFWIDSHEYTAPDWWMERQIEARKAMGTDVQQAATEAMEAWAREHEGESRCHANQ